MRFALVMLLVAVIATRAEAGRGTASLKYLPDDTNLVLAADVARSRNSPIFKKLFKLARENHAWLDTLATAQPVDKLIDTIVRRVRNQTDHTHRGDSQRQKHFPKTDSQLHGFAVLRNHSERRDD